MAERSASDLVVADVVGELGELVEDEVSRILGEHVAGVVDLFDVAFRTRGSDDVSWIGNPGIEPLEPFATHVFGEHGDATALHDATDRHSTAGVVASGWPHSTVAGGVELARNNARNETGISSENFMGADHREPVTESDDDLGIDTSELWWKDDVVGNVGASALEIVVPVDPEKVASVGRVAVDAVEIGPDRVVDGGRIRQLGERWQADALCLESADAAGVTGFVDDVGGEAEAGQI